MRRGILKLTPQELEAAITLIAGATYPTKALFENKLILAKNSSNPEKQVDINEQDAEGLLDILGIPMSTESADTASLRTKLQNVFLNDLG